MRRGAVPAGVGGRSLFRGLSSAVALVLLLVFVPVILAVEGGRPFPSDPVRRVRDLFAAHQSVDPRLFTGWLIHGIFLCAWVAWGWLVVCVAIEAASWASGRSVTRLPGSRTMQALAAFLVGTCMAMLANGKAAPVRLVTSVASQSARTSQLGTLRVIEHHGWPHDMPAGERVAGADGTRDVTSLSSVAGTPPGAPLGPIVLADDVERGAPSGPGSTNGSPERNNGQATSGHETSWPGGRAPEGGAASIPPSVSAVAGSTPIHIVGERETLWSIAEDRLGSARRWREIAVCNYGVRQPDGRMLTATHWVTPGWTLRLPPAAPVGVPLVTSDSRVPTHTVGPTYSEWPIAPEERCGPITMTATGGALGVPAPEPASAPISTSTASAISLSDAIAARSIENGANGLHVHHAGLPLAPVGTGLLGAGVVSLLGRIRRAQERHRDDGRFIRLPDPAHHVLERRLRSGHDPGAALAIDQALRMFSSSLRAAWDATGEREPGMRPDATPVIRAVRVHPDDVELIVEGLDTIPAVSPPFELRGDRASVFWKRASPALPGRGIRDYVAPGDSPCPALVALGRTPDGTVVVNLEETGSIALAGDLIACDGVMRGMALEMATSLWGSQCKLILVGFGDELARFDSVTSTSDVPSVLRTLHRRRLEGAARLDSVGVRTFAQARLVEDTGPWEPVVVLCGSSCAGEDVDELLEVGSAPKYGIATVAIGTHPRARHVLDLTRSRAGGVPDLVGLDVTSIIESQYVDVDDATGVCELVATAEDQSSVARTAYPYDTMSIPIPNDAKDLGTGDLETEPACAELVGRSLTTMPEIEVEVAILGPVEVRGAARQFTRAWAKELVVYLAVHRKGASNEAWATALWPERLMASSSLHSTASVARRSLGQASDGRDHLPRAHGRLALANTVGTDWDRFVALSNADGVDHWRTALELIRGRPFEDLRASDWPILEGIGPAIEASVVDLASRLAGRCLRDENPAGAEWAARKGLLVSPYDERLYRMLLRAADLAGNPAGVESVMSELLRLVGDDVEPFDSVHPETMDVYRSLTRRRATATVPR